MLSYRVLSCLVLSCVLFSLLGPCRRSAVHTVHVVPSRDSVVCDYCSELLVRSALWFPLCLLSDRSWCPDDEWESREQQWEGESQINWECVICTLQQTAHGSTSYSVDSSSSSCSRDKRTAASSHALDTDPHSHFFQFKLTYCVQHQYATMKITIAHTPQALISYHTLLYANLDGTAVHCNCTIKECMSNNCTSE